MGKIPIKQIVKYAPIVYKWIIEPFIIPWLKSKYNDKIKPKLNSLIYKLKNRKNGNRKKRGIHS